MLQTCVCSKTELCARMHAACMLPTYPASAARLNCARMHVCCLHAVNLPSTCSKTDFHVHACELLACCKPALCLQQANTLPKAQGWSSTNLDDLLPPGTQGKGFLRTSDSGEYAVPWCGSFSFNDPAFMKSAQGVFPVGPCCPLTTMWEFYPRIRI